VRFTPLYQFSFRSHGARPTEVVEGDLADDDPPDSLLDEVSNLRYRLTCATRLAHQNLKNSQCKMKTWYDKKAKNRSFKVGEKVLALLPIRQHPLQARYCGPYVVQGRLAIWIMSLIHLIDVRLSDYAT